MSNPNPDRNDTQPGVDTPRSGPAGAGPGTTPLETGSGYQPGADLETGQGGLATAPVETPAFEGNSISTACQGDLDACAQTARKTLATLDVASVHTETLSTGRRITGQRKDGTPARILLEKGEGKTTRLTFSAGSKKSTENQAFAQKMKGLYEASAQGQSAPEPVDKKV